MSILALDLSLTATGWAHSNGRSGVIVPRGEFARGIDRLRWIRWSVSQLRPFDLAVIEGYAFGRIQKAHHLGELGGVIRCALADANIPFVEIPPASLKMFATGKGNAKKDVVLTAAIQKLGYGGNSNDEADALWLLAMATVHYVRTDIPLGATERRALEAISWPTLSTPIEDTGCQASTPKS